MFDVCDTCPKCFKGDSFCSYCLEVEHFQTNLVYSCYDTSNAPSRAAQSFNYQSTWSEIFEHQATCRKDNCEANCILGGQTLSQQPLSIKRTYAFVRWMRIDIIAKHMEPMTGMSRTERKSTLHSLKLIKSAERYRWRKNSEDSV